ncbi:MAG: hypothetical protein WAL29_02610 [Bacteroidales bacterium]
MVKRYLFLTICILTVSSVVRSQSVRINGVLKSREDGKAIYNGVVFLRPGNQAVTSNSEGEYSFTTSPGLKQINTQAIGYKPLTVRFLARTDTVININLQVSPIELSEVTITGDSIKNAGITPLGSFFMTPAAVHQVPRLFSEPDLLKSFQFLPGVVSGKDGTSDIYVRGGSPGQNIVIADGCYFFLPGHLLGIVSPFDLDFLESAELYKDYFPAEIGGGASSIISLDFRKPHSDSMSAQLRLGLLSSGITIETPLKRINWDLTAGLKRGNYSLYAPLLKKIVSSDVGDFLPPDKYSFYDGFLRLSHSSPKWGDLSYLFFGNYDNGREENKTTGQSGDTLIKYIDGISTGWNNMVHALRWKLPVKSAFRWKIDLNYNRLSMGRKIFMEYEKFLNGSGAIESGRTLFQFSPVINNLGTTISVSRAGDKLRYTAGISHRFRYFSPNNFASNTIGNEETRNEFSSDNLVDENSIFFSSTALLTRKLQLDAGLRISYVITREAGFLISEPRFRLSFNNRGIISPHINYVRLAQNDHSAEGSNAGLRTMIWLPLYKELGPEISDVVSAGFQGQVNNDLIWSIDGYYKKTSGMVDYKPGASFIFDTSFVDMLDRVEGRAYGLETGIVKRKGIITGSASYTYSRSEREWGSPEGLIWIPSASDRPHSFNLALKYHFKERTSFGLNFVYQSGAPATIYMHETSYGEFFETKNNIRYFDYHRLDLSVRHTIYMRRFTIFLDADIYNAYNHKNTFYFKETFDEREQKYYYKNISLFPIMPSLTVTIKY